MTRFMMTLEDAVDLVIHAFENGRPGDIFVQKAPAATLTDLARAISEMLGMPDHPVRTIGARHGEKLYESLLTREEMRVAEDMDRYYRIPADMRDLNYRKYFEEGPVIERDEEYHSHNTTRLNVADTRRLLMKLSFMRAASEGRYEPSES
jgi:UDP-N-acetylglucosamine 4,6-dehydratase